MSRDAYELYVHRIDHVEVHIEDSQWKIPIVNALQLGQVDITRHGIRSYAFLLIRLLYPGDGSKIRLYNHLRLVIHPIICKSFFTSQVVAWDF